MGLNPIPFALLCVVAYSIQALMLDGEELAVEFPELEFESGVLSFFVSAFESIDQFLPFTLQFLTFGTLGAPWYIGTPLALLCNGSIIWALAQLLRGV